MRLNSNNKIPILLYHALFDGKSNNEKYAMSAGAFEHQIAHLAKHGAKSIDFNDLVNDQPTDLNKKNVIITFDDGNLSDYEYAFPILKQYDFTATFFVTVNRLGTHGYLDWNHLNEMKNAGMSIQSHGLNHSFLSDLSSDELNAELDLSKKHLETRLRIPVNFFSLPGGFYSSRVLQAAKGAGYIGVATSCPGLNVKACNKDGLHLFKRFLVTRKTDLQDLQNIVSVKHSYIMKSRLLYQAKLMAKKILGSQQYYSLWSKYSKYNSE